MSQKKPIVKNCAKCHKPFSTADENIIFCRACLDEKVKAEARAEIERQAQVVETKECPGCHKKFDITVGEKEYMEAHGMNPSPRFCKECRKELRKHKADIGKDVTCTDCGKVFKISAMTVLNSALHGWELPTRCPDCRKKVAEAARAAREARKPSGVYKTLTCKDCGKEFVITNGEHQFLMSHGYEFDPVRCKECRHKRKVQAVVNDMRRVADSDAMPGEENKMDVDAIGQQVGDPNVVPAGTMPDTVPDTTPDTAAADEDVGMDAAPSSEPVWEGDAPIPAQAVDWAAENAPEAGELEEKPASTWTEKENDILKRAFPAEGVEVPSRLPEVDYAPVSQQAAQLGVGWTDEELEAVRREVSSCPWAEEETAILKTYYPTEGTEVCKRLPGRTVVAVSQQARLLGIAPKEGWTTEEMDALKEQYPKQDEDNGEKTGAWMAEDNEALKQSYPEASSEGKIYINEAGKDPNAFAKTEDDLGVEPMNLGAAPAEDEMESAPAAEPSPLAVDAEKVAEMTKGLYPQDGEQTAAVDTEPEVKDKKPGFFGKLFGARD